MSFSTALYLSLLALPRVGILVAMFSGVPLVLAQLKFPAQLLGTGAMVTSGGLIFLLGSLLHNPIPGLQVLIYIGWCGLPALLTAEFLRRQVRVLPLIFSTSFQILFFLGGVAFFLYMKTNGQIWTGIAQSIHGAVDLVMNTAIKNSQSTLTPADQARVMALEPLVYRTFLDLLPGFFASLALLTSIVLWATSVGFLEARQIVAGLAGIDRWVLPDPLIFALISSLALLLVPSFPIRLLGTNLIMIFGVLYVGQGTGVLLSYVRRRKLGNWFWLVSGIFVLIQPMFLMILGVVGVIDIWADFRELRGKTTGGDGSGEEGRYVEKKMDDLSDRDGKHRDSFRTLCLCHSLGGPGYLGAFRGAAEFREPVWPT
ncbi:MAG: YybS family protein [Nitrospirae bacterium]|nr:YybS family protein [Nitrospirota bacterium]